jgi:hypothetical protein
MPVRLPVVAVVVVLGLTVALVATSLSASPSVSPPASLSGRSTASRATQATPSSAVLVGGSPGVLGVLERWDRQRAAAWAAGDVDALARLYTRGSSARLADVALLRQYAARGLVVRGMRMQLLRARVLVSRPRRLEIEVTDRLAGAIAVRLRPSEEAAASWRLPVDAATTRELVLRRIGQRWLMARVSARR